MEQFQNELQTILMNEARTYERENEEASSVEVASGLLSQCVVFVASRVRFGYHSDCIQVDYWMTGPDVIFNVSDSEAVREVMKRKPDHRVEYTEATFRSVWAEAMDYILRNS